MANLTTCLQKVGAKLDPADKAAVMARSRELRTLAKERGEPMSATDAAIQAAKDVISEIRAELKAAEPAQPAQRKSAHPKTVMGSELLAIVSARLGGLDPSLISEFSVNVPTGKFYKNGVERTEWRNPMIPGVGKLFRRGGRQDRQEIAQVLEDADYLEPGAVANDYKEAGERAKELIKAALDRNIPKTLSEQQAEMEASQEAERKAYYDALDEESAAEADAERAAIMAEAGMGRVEMAAVDDADLFNMAGGTTDTATQMRAMGFTEQEIADELAREAQVAAAAAQASPGQDAQAGPEAAPAAGPAGTAAAQPGSEPAEGLTLEAQTPESLESDSTRKKAAADAADVAAATGQGDIFDQPQVWPGGDQSAPGVSEEAAPAYIQQTKPTAEERRLARRGGRADGVEVPGSIDRIADSEAAMARAKGNAYPTNRALKVEMQNAVVQAGVAAGVNLGEFSVATEHYLVRVITSEARRALDEHANAIGWYREKVSKALAIMALVHPELATDAHSQFAFKWALAVTSNGIKVGKNFEMAEAAYQHWKRTGGVNGGTFPANLGQGTAAGQINKGLALFGPLMKRHGFERLSQMMDTLAPAGQHIKDIGAKIGGEYPDTPVYGSAILGPKIGNGFFANLNDHYEQLTIDRWLMRTWGRLTGTLIDVSPLEVQAKAGKLAQLVGELTPKQREQVETIIGQPIEDGDLMGAAQAILKASTKESNRDLLDLIGVIGPRMSARLDRMLGPARADSPRTALGDEIRKAGKALWMTADGQVEAPRGPKQRNEMRQVFNRVLAELQKSNPALTMSDLQAVLWYPEKRIYEAAKIEESGDESEGYADGAAPDYANAAASHAARLGVAQRDIDRVNAEVGRQAPAAGNRAGSVRNRTDGTRGGPALVAQESAPSDTYANDVFGNPVPAPAGSARKARPAGAGVRGVVQPEPAVPAQPSDTAAPAGDYHVRTTVGVTAQRQLGAKVIKTAADAAAATQYLYKSAVERLDGIVVDKDGKPLAVIGGFKGALSQASIYPATLMGEAVRVPGAAGIWFSHNHPSGSPELSRADEHLNANLADIFRGTGIEPKGLLAIGGGQFSYVAPGEMPGRVRQAQPIPAGKGAATVPAIERELAVNPAQRDKIDSPQAAKLIAARHYVAAGKKPGILLLDAQHGVAAWVPLPANTLGMLRGTGGLNAIYRAVSEANAGAAILVHGGELDANVAPGTGVSITLGENIGAALAKIDVRPLDIINGKTLQSVAEQGLKTSNGPVLSQTPALKQGPGRGVPLSTLKPHIDAITAKMPGLRNAVTVVGTVTDLPQGIVDSLRSMNALGTVRGLRMPDGRVFLVADKLDSQLEAEFVLFHEVFGHEGLRAILNAEEYARAMTLVRLSNKAVAAEADRWMNSYGADQIEARIQNGMTPEAARREVRLLAVEEALADRAGKNDAPSVWKNVMAIVQKALRRMGMNDLANWLENRTEAETYALLMQARKAITNPKKVHAFTPATSPLFQRAYHGTPARNIERFSTDFIGTGEGNQAYGYGLYFASRRDVAEYYRRALSGESDRVFTKDGKTLEGDADLAEAYYKPGRIVRGYSGADKVLQFKRNDNGGWGVQVVGVKANGEAMQFERPRWHSTLPDGSTLRSVLEEDGWNPSHAGQIYEVEIPGDDELLLWDKPMSEQPAKVRDALAPFIERYTDNQRKIMSAFSPAEIEREIKAGLKTISGQGIYEQAGYMEGGGDRSASEYLSSLGVKGIKYLDGVSRNKPLRDVKREFLAELPEDAGFDEVMDLIGSGTFSQKNEAVLRALADNDWLGFDYPAQAISTALSSQLSNFDPSPELVQAVAATQDDSTYNYVIFSGDDVAIQQALLSRRPPPLAPAVTVQPDANGNPEFAGDGVVLAYPQPAERFEFIPGPGQRLLNYAIMPATGFDSMGFVELVVENGRVTSLMDIEISGAGRRAGVGRKVIETILAANPEADLNISNIVHQARGFWAKMGVPEQNLEDGAAYDGTLNWQAYAQAANDGRAAQVGQGMRGETGADDGRRQGAGRGAEGGAQAPVLSQRDPTQTPAFERWFGDSVVTKDGKPGGVPLVVYHGTRQDFDAFDRGRAGSNYGNTAGIFFTDSRTEADYYTEAEDMDYNVRPGDSPRVVQAFLSLQNPLVLRTKGNATNYIDEAATITRIRQAESRGHDGVIVRGDDGAVYLAFNPEQIKSAIGNAGTFDPSSPSILLSQKPKTESGWAMPEGSKFDNFVHKFQDKNVDLKRSIGAIKQRVGEITDAIDAYLQEELFHGRAAKRTQDFVQTELEPLLADMKAKGIGTAQLDLYLHARHAEEANKLIAERNKDPNEGQKDIDGKVITSPLQDGGSGMLTKTARDYLAGKQVEIDGQTVTGPSGDGLKALQEVATKVDAIINKTRVYNLAYGLISPAEAKSWATMFQHYVPLFREDKDGGMGIGQGYSIKGPEAKHRTGSTAKVVDILANIALAREKAIVRGEKNRVAVALVGLAKANPNDDIWEFGPVTERRFNEQTGLVEVKMKNGWKSADNVLVAKIRTTKGAIEEVGVVFNERNERAMRMAAALKNLDAAQLEGAIALSAVVTRWFAAINTQYNPVFGFVNLVRDIGGASINLSSTPLKDKRAAVLKNIPAALRAVAATEAGMTAANKDMAALWEDMQREGGMTGFRELYRTSQDRAKDIEFALNPAAWMDGTMGKIFTAGGLLRGPASMAQFGATKLFRGLSHYNTAMEAATRLSVYKVALEQGLSKQRAASLAKNITVNFNRKGQAGLQAGALYAFFNAAVQGTARIGEVVFDTKNGQGLRITPAGLKIITGGVALGGLQAVALAMAGFDDDEPPQFVREKNLIIPTGWLTGKRDYVTIPMPLGWNVLPNIGRVTTEWAMSGFSDPRKRAFKLVGTVLDSFNPLGNATLAQTISPTPFDPFVALLENKDWTGKPIARQMFDKAAAGWKSSKDTATDHAKFIAKMVNYALGGTEHQGNQIWNATPDQIDYLIGQAFGGVARELGKAEQTVGALRTGEDLPAHKVPLLGRFYGNAEQSSAQASRFYENMERFDYHQAEVKGLAEAWRRANGLAVSADATDDPQYKAYRAKHPEVELIAESNRAEGVVRKLRKEKSQMLKDGKPRADVKEKEAEITAAMRAFNEAAKSAMKPEKAPALQE